MSQRVTHPTKQMKHMPHPKAFGWSMIRKCQEGPAMQTLQPLIHLALPRLLEVCRSLDWGDLCGRIRWCWYPDMMVFYGFLGRSVGKYWLLLCYLLMWCFSTFFFSGSESTVWTLWIFLGFVGGDGAKTTRRLWEITETVQRRGRLFSTFIGCTLWNTQVVQQFSTRVFKQTWHEQWTSKETNIKKGNTIRLLGIKHPYPFARWNRHDGNFPRDFTAFLKAMKAPEPWEASAAAWALGRLLDVNPAAMPDEAQVWRGWVAPRDGWDEVPSSKLTWQWKFTFSNRKYNNYILIIGFSISMLL